MKNFSALKLNVFNIGSAEKTAVAGLSAALREESRAVGFNICIFFITVKRNNFTGEFRNIAVKVIKLFCH